MFMFVFCFVLFVFFLLVSLLIIHNHKNLRHRCLGLMQIKHLLSKILHCLLKKLRKINLLLYPHQLRFHLLLLFIYLSLLTLFLYIYNKYLLNRFQELMEKLVLFQSNSEDVQLQNPKPIKLRYHVPSSILFHFLLLLKRLAKIIANLELNDANFRIFLLFPMCECFELFCFCFVWIVRKRKKKLFPKAEPHPSSYAILLQRIKHNNQFSFFAFGKLNDQLNKN